MAEDTVPDTGNADVDLPSYSKAVHLNYDDFYRSGGVFVDLVEPTDDSYTEIFPKIETPSDSDLTLDRNINGRNIINDNWHELAAGYDACDPFIDNEEAYYDIVEGVETILGGFFINKGPLEMKTNPNAKVDSPKKKKKSQKQQCLLDGENLADTERRVGKKVRKRKKPLEGVTSVVSGEEAKKESDAKTTSLPESNCSSEVLENFSEDEKALLVETRKALTTQCLDDIDSDTILQFSLLMLRILRKDSAAIIKQTFKNVPLPRNIFFKRCETQLMNYFNKKIDACINALVSDTTSAKPVIWIMNRPEFLEFCEHLQDIHKVARVFAKGSDKKALGLQQGSKISALCPDSLTLKDFYLSMYSQGLTTSKKARQIQQIRFLCSLAIQNGATAEEICSIEEKNSKVATQSSPVNQNRSSKEESEKVTKVDNVSLKEDIERDCEGELPTLIQTEPENVPSDPDIVISHVENEEVSFKPSLSSNGYWEKYSATLKECKTKMSDDFSHKSYKSEPAKDKSVIDKQKDVPQGEYFGSMLFGKYANKKAENLNASEPPPPKCVVPTANKVDNSTKVPVRYSELYSAEQQEAIWKAYEKNASYMNSQSNLRRNTTGGFSQTNKIGDSDIKIMKSEQKPNNILFNPNTNIRSIQFQRTKNQETNVPVDCCQIHGPYCNNNCYINRFYPGNLNPNSMESSLDYQRKNIWSSSGQFADASLLKHYRDYMYGNPDPKNK